MKMQHYHRWQIAVRERNSDSVLIQSSFVMLFFFSKTKTHIGGRETLLTVHEPFLGHVIV